MQRIRSLLLLVLALLAAPALVSAQDRYPSRPIRLVVPFAPGGTTDVLARLVAARMGEQLGQQVVVENKPGAGGNIGADGVAKAPPDGYTLLLGTPGPLAINGSLFKSMPFNPQRDFAPIGQLIGIPSVFIVAANSPHRALRDVLAQAKANPGRTSYASPGNGTTPHLAAELLKSMAGVDLQHVPYKGDAPAVTDLLGGQVPVMVSNVAGVAALIKDGRVRPLAVTSATRSKLLPDVPTVSESGVPGYAVTAWAGIVAPQGTPAPILARLHAELNKAMAAPDIQERLAQLSADPLPSASPEQFAQVLRAEEARWAKVIRDANIRLEP